MFMKWNWNVVCINGGIHQRKCSLASLFFAPMLLQMIPTSVHRIVCFVQNVFISRANMDVITWKQPRTTNLWKAAKAWTQKIEITFIGIRIWEENREQLIGYFWYKEVTLVSIKWHVRNHHYWEGEEVAFEVSRVWISALLRKHKEFGEKALRSLLLKCYKNCFCPLNMVFNNNAEL